MKKTMKASVIFAVSFIFVLLGISISFMTLNKANAETGSTGENVSATDPTEANYIIVTVPVYQTIPNPTEPTEPVPTQGETGDIKWVVNDDKQLIISKNNAGDTCSTGD
ncbi:MAG: hypothetical protein NC320_10660, partial [Clostridium sp.]|nr:hypothetical protein [Clostridium sp.]